VDANEGRVLAAEELSWDEVPIGSMLRQALNSDMPLYFENNLQGVGRCACKDVQTLKDAALAARHEDYVRKITEEVKGFGLTLMIGGSLAGETRTCPSKSAILNTFSWARYWFLACGSTRVRAARSPTHSDVYFLFTLTAGSGRS
jgi:hypothetical protein